VSGDSVVFGDTDPPGDVVVPGDPVCWTTNIAAPVASGTIRLLPELGIHDVAPIGNEVASDYWKTTDSNRTFRRGIVEFSVPAGVTGQSMAVVRFTANHVEYVPPVPPVTHLLSTIPGDGIVSIEDFDAGAIVIGNFQTDANAAFGDEVFEFSVVDYIPKQGGYFALRVELDLPPDFAEFWSDGSGFVDWELALTEPCATGP